MIIQTFSIKDRATDAFMRPFFAQAIGQAVRMFMDEVNNPQGDIFKHPDDYDLYHLGTFDDNTGQLQMNPEGPKQVAIGKQFKSA